MALLLTSKAMLDQLLLLPMPDADPTELPGLKQACRKFMYMSTVYWVRAGGSEPDGLVVLASAMKFMKYLREAWLTELGLSAVSDSESELSVAKLLALCFLEIGQCIALPKNNAGPDLYESMPSICPESERVRLKRAVSQLIPRVMVLFGNS